MMKEVTEGFDNDMTDHKVYSEMYFEWTRLFRHLGSAIVIAFKDITDKGKIIGGNQNKMT